MATAASNVPERYAVLLNTDARQFLSSLHRRFGAERSAVLGKRVPHFKAYPDFLPDTKHIRDNAAWHGPPLAPGLVDRRVEITGPATPRKMVINALNSDATQYMLDFEDSLAPTWLNILDGHQNATDAIRRTITVAEADGKQYALRKDRPLPTLLVRPRGWHMEEHGFVVDGSPMSASLFDFGLYMFHNARQTLAIGQGPYFYLPKMESYMEARLWAGVFAFAEEALGLPRYVIRATVLIETLPAVFQMDEILYELRNYSAGLNTGRWDYIFSFIKKMRTFPEFVMPDRENLTMATPFLTAYSTLLIQTCHKRGVHAIGGMSAHVPVRGDKVANEKAAEKVRADKLREVRAGCDGTWALHPDFVKVARAVFDEHMPGPNQLQVPPLPIKITQLDLLNRSAIPGSITSAGIRNNVRACILYLDAWIKGKGSVAVDGLMEDLATVEISRTQLWQWLHHGRVKREMLAVHIDEVCAQAKMAPQNPARTMLEAMLEPKRFHDFVSTLPALSKQQSKL